jgi:hypothetical protein
MDAFINLVNFAILFVSDGVTQVGTVVAYCLVAGVLIP